MNRKVIFVLAELDLTYEPSYLSTETGEQKSADFIKYNPNGRLPAIIDHANNDFVLWYASH